MGPQVVDSVSFSDLVNCRNKTVSPARSLPSVKKNLAAVRILRLLQVLVDEPGTIGRQSGACLVGNLKIEADRCRLRAGGRGDLSPERKVRKPAAGHSRTAGTTRLSSVGRIAAGSRTLFSPSCPRRQ